jgi:hypothetical protein
MTHVMCSPWKRTFTLVHIVPLTMFSPKMGYLKTNVTRFAISVFFRMKVYSFNEGVFTCTICHPEWNNTIPDNTQR